MLETRRDEFTRRLIYKSSFIHSFIPSRASQPGRFREIRCEERMKFSRSDRDVAACQKRWLRWKNKLFHRNAIKIRRNQNKKNSTALIKRLATYRYIDAMFHEWRRWRSRKGEKTIDYGNYMLNNNTSIDGNAVEILNRMDLWIKLGRGWLDVGSSHDD